MGDIPHGEKIPWLWTVPLMTCFCLLEQMLSCPEAFPLSSSAGLEVGWVHYVPASHAYVSPSCTTAQPPAPQVTAHQGPGIPCTTLDAEIVS